MQAYDRFDGLLLCVEIDYSKQYQLMGLLQTELVNDNSSNIFQSTNLIKFFKPMEVARNLHFTCC